MQSNLLIKDFVSLHFSFVTMVANIQTVSQFYSAIGNRIADDTVKR